MLPFLKEPPEQLGWFHPSTLTATWFWSGLFPFAPGTAGSAAALPFAFIISWVLGQWWLLPAAVLAFVAGLWACSIYAPATGKKDPGACVIDEVAGQFVTLAFIPAALTMTTLSWYIIGFLLFRAFDIVKPWPASKFDRELDGAMGIMLDDMISGLMAGVVLVIAYVLWNGVGNV